MVLRVFRFPRIHRIVGAGVEVPAEVGEDAGQERRRQSGGAVAFVFNGVADQIGW